MERATELFKANSPQFYDGIFSRYLLRAMGDWLRRDDPNDKALTDQDERCKDFNAQVYFPHDGHCTTTVADCQ